MRAALVLLAAYAVLQRRRVSSTLVYVPLVAATWWCVHESGVHATVAGIALGLLTRVIPDDDEARSPAERLEHRLVPLSAGVAVPFFALLSAGVVFSGDALGTPVALGVTLGLVVGKPLGVLGGVEPGPPSRPDGGPRRVRAADRAAPTRRRHRRADVRALGPPDVPRLGATLDGGPRRPARAGARRAPGPGR